MVRPAPPLSYVEQRSVDVCYYLLEGVAPRQLLRVLDERTVQLAHGRLTLAIIGSSHFLEIAAGNAALCELLACPTIAMAGLRCSYRLSGGTDWSHRYHAGGFTYGFDLWQERIGRRQFLAESRRLTEPGEHRLHYSFPKSRGADGAVTCLDWQIEGCVATVATYHTFPGELSVVRTRSVIDFTEAVARQ